MPTVWPSSCARVVDLRGGDHRGERPLDDRHDPDDVLAALARDREIVDVEDREVRRGRSRAA